MALLSVRTLVPKTTEPLPDKVVIVAADALRPLISNVPLLNKPLEVAMLPTPVKYKVALLLIVVSPTYVFAPLKVKLPALTVKSPAGSTIRPENVPDAFVSTNVLPDTSTVPAPLIVLTLTGEVEPTIVNVAPEATLTGLFAKLPVSVKVPLLMVVLPL